MNQKVGHNQNSVNVLIKDFENTISIPQITDKRLFQKTYTKQKGLKVPIIHHDLEWFPLKDGEQLVTDKNRLYTEAGPVIRLQFMNPETNEMIKGWALIDGGADVSGFDGFCGDRLNLKITKEAEETRGGGEHGSEKSKLYRLRIDIPQLRLTLTSNRAQRHTFLWGIFPGTAYIGIIGRDILRFCKQVYDSYSGEYYVEVDPEKVPKENLMPIPV